MENSSSEKNTNDEILDQLIKKVNELDKRKAELPDFAQELESLKKWIQEQMPAYSRSIKELERIVVQYNLNNPTQQIQKPLDEVKVILSKVPKNIPVKHYHYFDTKSKGWIIAGMILLIVLAISTGWSGHLFVQNLRVEANDIKFRVVRQAFPEIANEIEDGYAKNPEGMEVKLIELEAKALRKARAQERIDQLEKEIREKKKEMGRTRSEKR